MSNTFEIPYRSTLEPQKNQTIENPSSQQTVSPLFFPRKVIEVRQINDLAPVKFRCFVSRKATANKRAHS